MSNYQHLIKAIAFTFLWLVFLNLAKGQTLATDHFKSIATGNWNTIALWQSSHDGVIWETATMHPSSSANQILISQNTTVTVSSASLTGNKITVEQGATFVINYPFEILNSDGIDLTVYGVIQINSTLSIAGQISIMDGALYIQDVNKNNKIYSCNWEIGSTFKMVFSSTSPPNTLLFINSLNQTFYDVIIDGGQTLTSGLLNLPGGFRVNGTLKFLSSDNNFEFVFTASSAPVTYQINNIETYNPINTSNGVGLVTIQLAGNLIIDGDIGTRLCLGRNITTQNSNTLLEISGNIFIYGLAGINSNSQQKYGTIKFMKTNGIQYVSDNANIRRVNYIVNPDVSVSFNGIVLEQGYSLIMKNHSSLLTNSQIPVTIERNATNADWTIPFDGWHLLSSPVTNQSLSTGGFNTAPYDFYKWSESENQWLNQKVAVNNITSFIPGQGYLASYDNGGTLTFNGNLNSAPVTFNNLSVTQVSPYAGFHLLGNPFPCSLDWNATGWVKTNISGVAQVWDENARNYLPLTADNGIIPPTQGFFVQATTPVNNITIPTSARTHSNQQFYKDLPVNFLRLRMTSVSDSTFDETVLRLTENALPTFDLNDGHKLSGSENSPQLHSVIASGENLCVNSLPCNDPPAMVPLYFKPGFGYSYVLEARINTMQNEVWLEDKKTGNITLLEEGALISIQSSITDEISRFVLHFGPVGIAEEVASAPKVYSEGKSIYFRECDKYSYQVLDMTGQLVASGFIGNSLKQIDASFLKAGVYIVRLVGPDNMPSASKIILQ